ncbi:UNVERIFIED_CONTAM: hypothetical protein GTU68_023194 [Idotea baltica]|nr:hypothetical protein [Idotea baltica]
MDNAYVNAVLGSESFDRLITESNVKFIIDDEIINKLFKQLLNKEYFGLYNTITPKTTESELRIIHNIFKKIVLKNDVFISEIEEHFLGWTDDAQLVIKTVNKTLKNFFEKGEPYINYVLPEVNWKETNKYIEQLYLKVISENENLEKIIDPSLKNWDSNRLNITDYLLLKMAVCEFLHFPSIPVKVTINEYIEISKTYSTPKSKDFINGVLDKLLKQFRADNSLNKTGRGLIN